MTGREAAEILRQSRQRQMPDKDFETAFQMALDALEGYRGVKSKNRYEAINRKYEGFGEEHTNAEWSRLLSIPRNTLWKNLQKGLTVEEIAKNRGIKYK